MPHTMMFAVLKKSLHIKIVFDKVTFFFAIYMKNTKKSVAMMFKLKARG